MEAPTKQRKALSQVHSTTTLTPNANIMVIKAKDMTAAITATTAKGMTAAITAGVIKSRIFFM